MSENEKNTVTELTDAELEQAAGGGMGDGTETCPRCNRNNGQLVRRVNGQNVCHDCWVAAGCPD